MTSLRAGALPPLAAVLTAALFIRLGLWQRHKAELSAQAVAEYQERVRLPPKVLDDRIVDSTQINAAPIIATGHYEPEFQFFLDNRQNDGIPGVQVLTTLEIEPGETRVLVNRGWIAWPRRGVLPEVPVPQGRVSVTGIADTPSTKRFFLMSEAPESQGPLWTRVDLKRLAQLIHHPVQPIVLLQSASDPANGLVRKWPPPDDKSLMHRGYEYQWFAMATALVLFCAHAFVRRKTP